MTVADVLSDIKRQLDWRGPTDKPQGHIVLSREQAEYLHAMVIETIIERDDLLWHKERSS